MKSESRRRETLSLKEVDYQRKIWGLGGAEDREMPPPLIETGGLREKLRVIRWDELRVTR